MYNNLIKYLASVSMYDKQALVIYSYYSKQVSVHPYKLI